MKNKQGKINMMYQATNIDFHEENGYAEMTVTIKSTKIKYGKIYVYIDDGKDTTCPICGSKLVGGK